MEFFLQVEAFLVERLSWPLWALRTIESLLGLIVFVSGIETLLGFGGAAESTKISKPTREFRMFQLQYLWVYFLTMLADWLQGTNMYTLYSVCEYFKSNYIL